VHAVPSIGEPTALGQEHHDLGLQGVSVLELVDEQVIEPARARATDHRIVTHQIAEAQQQVELINRAAARLHVLVDPEHDRSQPHQPRGHPRAQRRQQVIAQCAVPDRVLAIVAIERLPRIPRPPVAAKVVGEPRRVAGAPARPALEPLHDLTKDQCRVGLAKCAPEHVRGLGEPPPSPALIGQPRDVGAILVDVALEDAALESDKRRLGDLHVAPKHQPRDQAVEPVERPVASLSRAQSQPGAPEVVERGDRLAGAITRSAAGEELAERAVLGGVEQRLDALVNQARRVVFELIVGIERRLHRPGAEQAIRERVDRRDVGGVEPRERLHQRLEPRIARARRRERGEDPLSRADAQLARGLAGERDRGHTLDRRRPAVVTRRDQLDEPFDDQTRLAGSRRRVDQHVALTLVDGARSGLEIREWRHTLSSRNEASGPVAARSSSFVSSA
jgi:hypothetical protein